MQYRYIHTYSHIHTSDVVEAQVRLDASRQFLANFLVILNHIEHLNFTDCFGGVGFALDLNNDLQTLSKLFFFFPHQVLYTLYHQCSQRIRAQTLFKLPLHHIYTQVLTYTYTYTHTHTYIHTYLRIHMLRIHIIYIT